MKTLVDLQKAAQVEFALVRQGGQLYLVRGYRTSVIVPEGMQVVAHTHPGNNIFAVRPSLDDVRTLADLEQKSSIVVTEEGIAAEFTYAIDEFGEFIRKIVRIWNVN